MNKSSIDDDVIYEIKVLCQQWQRIHDRILAANGQRRERLLFEECQLERHVQRLMDNYHGLLFNSALPKRIK